MRSRTMLIRSRYYTGVTGDVAARLREHNQGRSTHTASGRPWHVDVIVEFTDKARAARLEQMTKESQEGTRKESWD